ncbi:hypothetical protein J7E91_09565 [Streptomyces sp. ISL-99]|uniref:hypothetical protein n=1 Tax=Streptomyces sp. ISL-99 TaxID=2819193 RepID=UPI001BE4F37C|nr:hypothetical protein [Streptomyces sp. ISL-99]MBT2525673.1 hypothetical protein [Streptomyces sp. ISL-99]
MTQLQDSSPRARPGVGPLTLVVSLLVLAGLGFLLREPLGDAWPDGCGERLEKLGGECVGVTDGSHVFMDELAEVSARIKEENKRVEKKPHVTIALMIPMASDHADVRKMILHEVQGAYIAQYRANNDPEESGDPPAIRMVLAHPGKTREEWRPVTEELARMAKSPEDNLRVVFGFDLSVQSTKDAIDDLTNNKGIPVVGGALTGGIGNPDIDHIRYKGFARVVPDNAEQADALALYDKKRDSKRAILVEDRREKDDYVRSLREAFERRLRGSPRDPLSFVSPGPDDESGLSAEFRRMTTNICATTPPVDTVYFAGRPVHLRQFVNALAVHRPCGDRDFTVVSGSGASTLYADEKLDWEALRGDTSTGRRQVVVQYTSVAHPDSWVSKKAPATGGSAGPVQKLRRCLEGKPPCAEAVPMGPADISDSRTISAHDSAWTAIRGIRIHAEGTDGLPSLRDIRNDWDGLQGVDKVEGASGWICLDGAGNPYNKAVAVVRLNPFEKKPQFVDLAWPRGAPPVRDPRNTGACQIPRQR